MADSPRLSEKAQKALRLWQDGCLKGHRDFITKYKRRLDAYHAILDPLEDAAQWTSKQSPPIVQHIVETTLAGLVDTKLQFRIRPKRRLWNPGEFEQIKRGAEAHEILHACQFSEDKFSEKQRPFALQDAIAGLTVMKNSYRRDRARRPVLKVENGAPEELQMMGAFLPRLVEREEVVTNYDGPCSEVVNVEDFFWHEAAIELQKSPVIAHRVWMDFNDLKASSEYQNVDQLKDSKSQGEGYTQHRVDGTDRTKDMIEVLEIWWKDDGGIWTVTLGNQAVELKAAKKNPFWHGEYPFVVCSTRPDLFRIPGVSQVEKIADLQLAAWDLENQTRDNVRLINNAIIMLRSDIDDPDAYEHEPGARWLVEDPAQVQMWAPQPIGDLALPHLARIERQMQDLAGSQPFTSTSEARNQGADTATEAGILTNLAQQSTLRLREQLNYAYGRIGQQRTELNAQFIRTSVMAEKVGIDSEPEFVEIAPYLLQGDYHFDISPMNESLMRNEQRAEANAKMQMAAQAAPISAALAQAGAATPLNWDEFVRDWLRAYGEENPDRFFSAKQQPQLAAPQAAAGGGGVAPPAPGGVTAPQATNPVSSPSSDLTVNPVAAMQQMQAQVGGLNGG